MTIEKYSQDDLVREVWEFVVIRQSIVLNEYIVYKRQAKRHKATLINRYSRIFRCNLDEKQVPLTDELRKEVLDLFTSTLKVQTASEYKASLNP